MSSEPVINIMSVQNLPYNRKNKLGSSSSYLSPEKFEVMKVRAKNNSELYLRKTDLKESLQKLLVPNKEAIEKQINCECGPSKLSIAQ